MKTKVSLSSVAVALALGACATSQPAGPQATAVLRPASGSQVQGSVTFTQIGENLVRVNGQLTGHTPGQKGFHIHEKGDCSAPDATSAGGHFNPAQHKHGATPVTGHAGDLGNVIFDGSGKATVDTVVSGISVSPKAPNGIVGRAVVVHMSADDLTTDPTGNSGARVACGVIS